MGLPWWPFLLAQAFAFEGCEDFVLLQTAVSMEESGSAGTGSSFDQEVASLSDGLDNLEELLKSKRWNYTRQAELFQAQSSLAMKVMATSSSRFDDWCKAHAELALGFLSFLGSSVLLCLCIPCGLSPVQLLGACLVEEEPLRKDAGHRPKADHPRHRHRVGSPTVRSP